MPVFDSFDGGHGQGTIVLTGGLGRHAVVMACQPWLISDIEGGRIGNRVTTRLVLVEDFFHPAGAAEDVFPAVGEDGDELEEAVGDTWDECDFDMVFFVEFVFGFYQTEFFSLDEKIILCLAKSACEDHSVIDEWVSLPSQEVRFWELGK